MTVRRATFHGPAILALAALIIAHSAVLLYYVPRHMHGAPLFGDEADKISQAAKYFYSKDMAVLDGAPYPPALYFATQPPFKYFGVGKNVAVATNILFIAILMISVYRLAANLGAGPWRGLFAAALVMFFPGAFALSRIYFQDFANIAMTSAALAFLAATRGFTSRSRTLAFGLVCGLGMLTRANFCIFLFGPAIGVFAMTMSGRAAWGHDIPLHGRFRRDAVINTALGLALSLAVASIWYLRDYPNVIRYGTQRVTLDANVAGVAWHSVKSLFFYLYSLIDYQISELLFIPVAGLGTWAAIKRFPSCLPLVLCVAGAYLFFVFPEWKLARYIAPMLPAIAVCAAVGAASVKTKAIRWIIMALCLTCGAAQFYFLTFPSRYTESDFIGSGRIASRLFGFKMHIDDYQDDIPRAMDHTNFYIAESGDALLQFLKTHRSRFEGGVSVAPKTFTMSCFAEASSIHPIATGEMKIDCGYPWAYISAVNNLKMRVVMGAVMPDGQIKLHETPDFNPDDVHPGNSDVIATYDPGFLSKQNLQNRYELLGSWRVAGNVVPLLLYGSK